MSRSLGYYIKRNRFIEFILIVWFFKGKWVFSRRFLEGFRLNCGECKVYYFD